MELSAVLFDVDGTVAETEEYHRKSFNESFKEFNLDWFWDEAIYKELINIGGGKERIMYHIKKAWPEMLGYKNLSNYIDSIHKIKNEIYEDYIKESKIETRPGVLRLIDELKKNKIKVALVSSTSEINLTNLFEKGLKINPSEYFDIIAHGDCTKLKKPSSEIYQWTLEKFQLPPNACVAIEDSPRGLESSSGANIKTVVTPSKLTLDEDFGGAQLVVSDLGEPDKPFETFAGDTFGFKYVSLDLLQKICSN
jgi:HAD superfamily hydrolase (TIGR01509 family)